MATSLLLFLLITFFVCFLTIRFNKLTFTGALLGFLIALTIFYAFGFPGVAILGCFFTLATIASFWNKQVDKSIWLSKEHSTRRDALQVAANGSVSALCAALSVAFPVHHDLFLLMMVGGLSSATADTISSELGTVYGSKFINILTFKPDQKGENGVISVEGLLFGLAGSCALAIVFSFGFGWDSRFFVIIISGTIGNLTDSVLGATLERNGYLGNNQVNFSNTLVAALSVIFLVQLL